MVSNEKRWKVLLFFCLGLAIGTAFCMKWMESDLQAGGRPFSIIGLELFYDPEKMTQVLSGIDEKVRTILLYHLSFDFVFMAGIFPFIASLCMLASYKTRNSIIKKTLVIIGSLQLLAWALDIFENCHLIGWVNNPSIQENDLFIFHLAVTVKWVISLAGFLLGLVVILFRKRSLAVS